MKNWILFFLLTPFSWGAPKKSLLPPAFDPPDQLFRMAPMPQSSRSVAIPLSRHLFLAYDTKLCRIHSVWKGGPLKLFGPGYHGGKRPFICQPNGQSLWGNPSISPWRFLKEGKPELLYKPCKIKFSGISTDTDRVTFIYKLLIPETPPVQIRECVFAIKDSVVRRIEVGPCPHALMYLAHVEKGKMPKGGNGNTAHFELLNNKTIATDFVRPDFPGGVLGFSPHYGNFTVETFTEEGTLKGNPKRLEENGYLELQLKFPKSKIPFTFHFSSTIKQDKEFRLQNELKKEELNRRVSPHQPLILKTNPHARRSNALSPYYQTEAFALPEKMNLMVTGMDWLSKNQLAVSTYAGEVWIVEDATGPVKDMKFRRFARGMNEPMGVLVKDGDIHLGNKAEITRLRDTNKNGAADLFECVNRDWDYTGSYNAFSYGPVLDRNGNFVVANAGHAGRWSARHMGWALRIKSGSDKADAFASGFREPNGIGTFGPDKDIFVTDNQGAWIGACKLNHVKNGGFFGHPASKPAPKELYGGRQSFSPPAVWFPYKMARSSSGMCEITDDRFGPFKGQMLVGDFQNAIVTRVQLEKIDGEWQGAVWPFLKGFQSGVNRLAMGMDGHLYVGGCKTVAWAANAPFSQGLERVKFNGKIPFEVKTVRAMPDGFELTFTKPVDSKTASDAAGYDVWQYKYKYHKKYGSPEFDHDGKPDSFTAIEVKSADVSKDRLKVRLRLAGWKAGYITAVRGLDARSATGDKLWHNTFHYTLNRIPR